jgi:hypothetical protein
MRAHDRHKSSTRPYQGISSGGFAMTPKMPNCPLAQPMSMHTRPHTSPEGH